MRQNEGKIGYFNSRKGTKNRNIWKKGWWIVK
jgi:hypothetical protein